MLIALASKSNVAYRQRHNHEPQTTVTIEVPLCWRINLVTD